MFRFNRKKDKSQPMLYHFQAELPSAEPDLRLNTSFELSWQHIVGAYCHDDPEAAIRDHIRTFAEKISKDEPITRFYIVQDRLNAAFGAPHDLDGAAIRVLWVRSKVMKIDQNVLTEALKRERLQNETRLREKQQQDEIRHIESFRSRVLADPSMALAYWFMKQPDTITTSSYSEIENLARTVASYDSNNSWVQIAQIIQDFVRDLTHTERCQSIDVLRELFYRYGMPEYAKRLPQEFDNSAIE